MIFTYLSGTVWFSPSTHVMQNALCQRCCMVWAGEDKTGPSEYAYMCTFIHTVQLFHIFLPFLGFSYKWFWVQLREREREHYACCPSSKLLRTACIDLAHFFTLTTTVLWYKFGWEIVKGHPVHLRIEWGFDHESPPLQMWHFATTPLFHSS